MDISTLMMIAFVVAMIGGIWKLYAFMPNKQLEDDDTTKEATDELLNLVIKNLRDANDGITLDELFVKIQEDEEFDGKRFWRFNKNRLRQLLSLYCVKNPEVENSIDKIKEHIACKKDEE